MSEILDIIQRLDSLSLPSDLAVEEMVEALRRIEAIVAKEAKESNRSVVVNGVNVLDCCALHHDN